MESEAMESEATESEAMGARDDAMVVASTTAMAAAGGSALRSAQGTAALRRKAVDKPPRMDELCCSLGFLPFLYRRRSLHRDLVTWKEIQRLDLDR